MTKPKNAGFENLGLREELLANLKTLGYEAPTPIQERTIPILLAGHDLIGQAQTGTGKTAAFALPILQAIDPKLRATQALVLAPTRELAMQVAEAIHTYARGMGEISVVPVYGGAPIVPQLRHLERGAHVVVGTPGRLIDHLERGTLKLNSLRVLVLDEADEMLRMGFIDDIERILSAAPADRQTALFSATMPRQVLRIAERYLRDPQNVEIEHHALTTPAIEQRFINLIEGQKLDVLTQILELGEDGATLIFRSTKTGAAELAEKLEGRGFSAAAMHGDMNQVMRERVIRRLKAGQLEIVVATDVAARGLDVEQISHVVNYDIPWDVEVYVHRIGRTGRAGRSGVATLFCTPRDRRMMRDIERFTGKPIKPMKVPTRADVAARRVAAFKQTVRENIELGDLDLYVALVEQIAAEGPFDMADVAAAAARLANGTRSLAPEPEPVFVAPASVPQSDKKFDKKKKGGMDSRPRRPGPDRDDREPKVKIELAVGKQDGLRPADIVGSIANEAGVPGRSIGPIEINENNAIVTVPASHLDEILRSLARAKFKNKPFGIRVADESEQTRPARPHGEESKPKDHGKIRKNPYSADKPARKPGFFDRAAKGSKDKGKRKKPR